MNSWYVISPGFFPDALHRIEQSAAFIDTLRNTIRLTALEKRAEHIAAVRVLIRLVIVNKLNGNITPMTIKFKNY